MSSNEPFGVANATQPERVGVGFGGERMGVGNASETPGVGRGDGGSSGQKSGQKSDIARQFRKKALAILLTSVIAATGLYEASRIHKGEGLGLPSLPGVTSLTTLFNHHAKNVPPGLQSYVNDPADASAVNDLKNDLAQTKYGQALLGFAKDNNITFAFDSKVGNILAKYDPAKSQVQLNTGMKSEANVLFAIEALRFAWQDKVLHAGMVENTALTADQRWALLRVRTADAQAFTAYVEADRIKQNIADEGGLAKTITGLRDGKSLAEQTGAANVVQIAKAAEDLSNAQNGITYNDYLRHAFLPMLKEPVGGFAAALLNVGIHSAAFTRAVSMAGNDPAKIAAVEKAVGATPNAAAFDTLLAQMGGLSLRPDGITSLQGIAPRRLTEELPWTGMPSNMADDARHVFKLADAQQQRDLAQLHTAAQRANVPRAGS